jgi:ribosomal protein L18
LASKKTLKIRAKREKEQGQNLSERRKSLVFPYSGVTKHIYAQAINDTQASTLATASTLCKDWLKRLKTKRKWMSPRKSAN